MWRTVTRINGDLTIRAAITSFPDFAALRVVEGDLSILDITTSSLAVLDDIFPKLDTIHESLRIHSQSVVQTITGFRTLDSLGGSLSVYNNASLRTLPLFSALKYIDNNFVIEDNDALTTVASFQSLQTIGDDFKIEDNSKLTGYFGL